MIEDIGPYGIAFIGIVVLICILVAAKDRYPKHVNEESMGILYMMYFWGAHTANQIVREAIDPDYPMWRVRITWDEMRRLEKMGMIEVEHPSELSYPSWEQHFVMTDEGEEMYRTYAHRFDMDYYEDGLVEAGPQRSKDVFPS
jgi:hypothetical protein